MKVNKTKVLIVDDSAVVRKLLTDALSKSNQIEVVGSALDPIIAVDKIKKYNPDVLTLDIEMPRMDGLTFLSKLMISHPMPVIMASSKTEKGTSATMKALELGAVDFVLKPTIDNQSEMEEFTEILTEKVIAACGAKIKTNINRETKGTHTLLSDSKKYSADVILKKKSQGAKRPSSKIVVAIGASTGGTEVIAEILSSLPENVPGIVIAQHMPEKFTKAFADRINTITKLYVKEAENGDRVKTGTVLIAPGNTHMLIRSDTNGYWVEINNGPPVNRHRPSVDVLFRSFSNTVPENSLGIILTGMGSDGAAGLLEIKEAGINTIAQDKTSSVVFGMPNEAIKLGAANLVMNISQITEYIKGLSIKNRV